MTEDNNNNKDEEIFDEKIKDSATSDKTGDIEGFDLSEPKQNKFKELIENLKEIVTSKSQELKYKVQSLISKKKTFNIKSDDENLRSGNAKITALEKIQFALKQLELEKLVSTIFDPHSRTKINHITILAIIVVSVYSTGKLIAMGLRGKETAQIQKFATMQLSSNSLNSSEIDQIKNNNVFKTMSSEVQSTSPDLAQGKKFTPEKCMKADRQTNLPIKLVNTIVLQDIIKSVASVQVRGKIENFRLGENIVDMAKIDKISRRELVIKNLKSGECELVPGSVQDQVSKISVMTPKKSRDYKANLVKVKGITNDGNKFKIKKSLLEDQLKDLSALLTQARAIKIENPDGTLSFKIVEIEPGSIFSTLGVQSDDIITQINGNPIRNMNEIMALFSKLRNMSNLQLGVNRMGTPTKFEYSFE